MDKQGEKQQILEDLKEAVAELNLILSCKKDARDADDWLAELSEDQQQSVMRGIQQADRGKTISHKDAITRLGL